MKLEKITDLQKWEKLELELDKTNTLHSFLHSKNWLKLNQDLKNLVWTYSILDNQNSVLAIFLVIKIIAKRSTFLLVPHGPLLKQEKQLTEKKKYQILEKITKSLIELGKKEQCSFIRIAPLIEDNLENQKIFQQLSFKKAPIHIHTELTNIIDITGTEQQILSKTRKTTRQMIKKAVKMLEKKELELKLVDQIDDEMLKIYHQTYKRGGAKPFSDDFVLKEWQNFKEKAGLICIYFEKKLISWGMVIFHNKTAYYHQGGNILYKNIPNSYLLQWKGIQLAKQNNCDFYDFWGVAPKDKPNHPWTNISLFKRGFGGKDVQLLHAQDKILSYKYYLNWIIEKYRNIKKGF